MTALAITGDWNATPADRGRWSPSWLADAAQLRILSAGPGRHGDIDYAMTNAAAGHPARSAPPGPPAGASDHDVYSVRLTDPDAAHVALVLVSWNVEYGRSVTRVRSDLTQVLHGRTAGVVALQEAADYHAVIHDVGRLYGYRVLLSARPGRWHQVLMVRADLAVAGPRFVQLSPHGWRLVAGGSHAELWATSWLVAGWLRVVDVHLPPSVNWSGGRIRGPIMRVAAYVATMRKLRSWARRWHRKN